MRDCPICRGNSLSHILVREDVPIFQNVLYRSEMDALTAPTGRIDLVSCERCGFSFNAAFEPHRVKYGPQYENEQSISVIFSQHVDAMVDRVVAASPPTGVIVEVGCGQGTFLKRIAQHKAAKSMRLYGFDPSYRDAQLPTGVSIFASLYDGQIASKASEDPDIILARHVIEHVYDPVGFLSTIRQSVKKRQVKIFLETPSFEWIIRSRTICDIFYEHANYFSVETLGAALTLAGFSSLRIEHVFGGQYLWAEALAGDEYKTPVFRAYDALKPTIKTAIEFGAHVEMQRAHWAEYLNDGIPTAIWGAGGKGNTFATLIDPEQKLVECLIDVNPRKQGTFVPVAGHPIVSPRDAMQRGIRRILVMNPNYRTEIEQNIADHHWSVALVDLG